MLSFIGRLSCCVAFVVVGGGCQPFASFGGTTPELRIEWADDKLWISGEGVPGGRVEIWYLEAYCRGGSTDRDWSGTTLGHSTELVEATADGSSIRLRCSVTGGVEVEHEIRVVNDGVAFDVRARNPGGEYVEAVWVQPCMRVGEFTGRDQATYIERSFIFLDGAPVFLHSTRRTEEARYRGGQVYVPPGIDHADVNPRPISPEVPSNGLIGCVSEDGEWMLAMAWEPYQELFQGVIVCLHSDFRLGGLAPGEEKRARGRVYLLRGSVDDLTARYERDFPRQATEQARAALRIRTSVDR